MEYQLAGRPQQLPSVEASRFVVNTPSACTSRERYLDLRASAPVVAPSLLLCDFGHLADEIRKLEEAGAKSMHLDVMDGHFVPNITYGLPIVEAVRRLTSLPVEAHLMISDPASYAPAFIKAGADAITFHVEAVNDPAPVLAEIRRLGAAAGLAYNPRTPVASIEPFLAECDLVLTMSVEAGFGGQAFQPIALDNLRHLRALVGGDVLLEIDGGVSADTIGACAEAGAQLFVVGSAIFKYPPYAQALAKLTDEARSKART